MGEHGCSHHWNEWHHLRYLITLRRPRQMAPFCIAFNAPHITRDRTSFSTPHIMASQNRDDAAFNFGEADVWKWCCFFKSDDDGVVVSRPLGRFHCAGRSTCTFLSVPRSSASQRYGNVGFHINAGMWKQYRFLKFEDDGSVVFRPLGQDPFCGEIDVHIC